MSPRLAKKLGEYPLLPVIFIAWVIAFSSTAGGRVNDDQQIDRLIAQLNSDSYRAREQAAGQLAAFGTAAVPQLATQVIAGRPEPAMRSAKILEQIGVEGDENSVIQIARLYLLLSQHGHPQFEERALQLNRRWKKLRIKKTIEQLREIGVQVDAAGTNQFLDPLVVDVLAVEEAVSGDDEDDESNESSQPIKNPYVESSKLTQDELLVKVSKLLNATPEENQTQFSSEVAQLQAARPSVGRANVQEQIIARRGAGGIVILGGIPPAHAGSAAEQLYSVVIDDRFKGSDDDLTALRMLPNIQQLTIQNRKLSAQLIEIVKANQSLQVLSLADAEFDLGELFALMRDRPMLYVDTSGSAFLGVTAQNDEINGRRTCRIGSVVPQSAADEAGLRPSDTIAKIDGVAIESFQQLVVAIAAYLPGDEIEVEIRRDGEIKKIMATLKSRPADM